MPKLKLTSAAVERLKTPETGQVDYFDATLPAFGLRVGKRKRMYFIIIRIHGKRSRITLGQAKVGVGPGMTLAEARAKAGEVSDQAALGIDPRQLRASEKAANQRRSENTFGAIAAALASAPPAVPPGARAVLRCDSEYAMGVCVCVCVCVPPPM